VTERHFIVSSKSWKPTEGEGFASRTQELESACELETACHGNVQLVSYTRLQTCSPDIA